MIAGSLTARSFRFALVFAGQPQMRTDKNIKFYDQLTAQGVDFPSFEQRKNEIVLQNIGATGPKHIIRISVGHFEDKFRLFGMEDFPSRSIEIFNEIADKSWDVFGQIWNLLPQSLALAEVTLRYTAAAKGGNATEFLASTCLRLPSESVKSLGRPLSGIGLRIVSPVMISAQEGKISLANADINAHVETLLEDPSLLYIQITVKWPSLPLPPARGQGGYPEGMPTFLNPECRKPSWYLKEVESYVTNQLTKFLCAAK